MDLSERKQKISGERIENTRKFFKNRGLSFDSVIEAFKYQINDYRYLLLTSSPVHGIANISSDIDVICITDQEIPLPRMASQSFKGSDHFEIISFSHREIQETLGFLEKVGERTVPSAIEMLGQWKKYSQVSKKYIERIVNGVDITMTTPYIDSLFTVGDVWEKQSFEKFRRLAILAILSETAGETRGRIGYALNGLQFLMDCLMSRHGYVFCNKKWYQFRFKLFIEECGYSGEFFPIVEDLIECHDVLSREIKGFREPLGNRLLELYRSAKEALGYTFSEDPVLCPDGSSQPMPFLRNSFLNIDEASAAILLEKNRENETVPSGVSDIMSLGAPEALGALNKIRAGLLKVQIPVPPTAQDG